MGQMISVIIATALVAVLTSAVAVPARAERAQTAGHASIGALLGYGFDRRMNVGIGLRGGYTLPMNLYLGGTFMYYLGESDTSAGLVAKIDSYYFGVEGGYDIAAGPVVVRPYLEFGDITVSSSTKGCVTVDASGNQMCMGLASTGSKFGGGPGVTALYPLGSAFVGADARYFITTAYNALTLSLTGGVSF